MQTRSVIIWIVVLVLVVLGLWYWVSTPGQGGAGPMATSTAATSTAATSTASSTDTGSASVPAKGSKLSSLASQTSNFTCTLTAVSSSGQATGTIYGAGGKVRVDFSLPSNNGSITSHVIRSGGYAYSWVDGQSTGTKTAISTGSPITAPGQGGVISIDSATASECHPWVPDSSEFTPPKGITFTAR